MTVLDVAPKTTAADFSYEKLAEIRHALLKAADIQEQLGHCTGFLVDEEGRVCPAGAIAIAVGYTVEDIKKHAVNKGGHMHDEGLYDELDRNPVFIYLGDHFKWETSPSRELGATNDLKFKDELTVAKTLRQVAVQI